MPHFTIFSFLSLLFFSFLSSSKASHQPCFEYEAVSAPKVDLRHRTGFHFQPHRNWINDPNAPMYYNGIYHLFYQYNPRGSVWGKIAWGHAVSTDLIHWKELKPALYPTSPFDKYGVWSGSATILPGNKPVILYTGVVDESWNEVQNYAIPANRSDPYLREWVKPRDNPLIVGDPGVNLTSFRDPTTAWRGSDGHWRILIGSQRRHRGIGYMYRSRDFKKWVKTKHPIYSAEKTGNWECLDFFPVSGRGTNGLKLSMLEKQGVKCVMKVSLDRTRFDYYTMGRYFPKVDRFVPHSSFKDGANGLRIDYGNFYASKSFFDDRKNRRVLWGWTNESDSRMDDVEKGWAGMQGIPRKIWMDPNGKQLLQWPVEEVESLREHKVEIRNHKLKKGKVIEVKGITAAQADVEVVFSFPSLDKAESFHPSWADLNAQDLCSKKGSTVQGGLGPFGLLTLASKNLEEYTPVFFRIFKTKNNNFKILLCSDASKSSLKKELYKPSFAGFVDADISNKKLSLRSLIDHSVVESFGNGGKVCITSRVYPTLAMFNNAHLYAFNNGTETINIDTLKAWTMKSTSPTVELYEDMETTP